MARRNPLGSITDSAIGAVKHPVGTAGKAAEQVKASVGLGKLVTNQTVRVLLSALLEAASAVVDVARQSMPGQGASEEQGDDAGTSVTGTLRAVPPVNEPAHPTPSDVAPVDAVTSGAAVASRAAAGKVTADAGDALTPGSLATRAAAEKSAEKSPTKKAEKKTAQKAAQKAAATKAPAKKAAAKKTAAKKAATKAPGKKAAAGEPPVKKITPSPETEPVEPPAPPVSDVDRVGPEDLEAAEHATPVDVAQTLAQKSAQKKAAPSPEE